MNNHRPPGSLDGTIAAAFAPGDNNAEVVAMNRMPDENRYAREMTCYGIEPPEDDTDLS